MQTQNMTQACNNEISNPILSTNVCADDLWWSSSAILISKNDLDKLTIVLHCFFIAEECWTSSVQMWITRPSAWGLFITLFGVKGFLYLL